LIKIPINDPETQASIKELEGSAFDVATKELDKLKADSNKTNGTAIQGNSTSDPQSKLA